MLNRELLRESKKTRLELGIAALRLRGALAGKTVTILTGPGGLTKLVIKRTLRERTEGMQGGTEQPL